jgi:hypothetical protein
MRLCSDPFCLYLIIDKQKQQKPEPTKQAAAAAAVASESLIKKGNRKPPNKSPPEQQQRQPNPPHLQSIKHYQNTIMPLYYHHGVFTPADLKAEAPPAAMVFVNSITGSVKEVCIL